MKSYDPSKFQLTAPRFARIYDKNLLGCKSEPISAGFSLSIVYNLSKISQKLLESHDFMILLRFDGNQALPDFRVLLYFSKFAHVVMLMCYGTPCTNTPIAESKSGSQVKR